MKHTQDGAPGTPGARVRVALPWLLLASGAAVLAVHVRTYAFVTDDAYISFRYARNWAQGAGLVFNPGDAPVEGVLEDPQTPVKPFFGDLNLKIHDSP